MRSVYRAMRARRIQQPKHPAVRFQPLALFKNSEPGVWYDPSDFSTMFQDSAGTTPVTAVEQPVGLMLDKSKGPVLGPELVTNGTFDSNINGWSVLSTATQTWTSNGIEVSRGGASFVSQSAGQISLVAGKTYVVTCDVTVAPTAGNGSIGVFGANRLTERTLPGSAARNTVGELRTVFTATTTETAFVVVGLAGTTVGTVTFDNISVRELLGNHASQPTATSRPVLSARVNLLTKTEQFDDAVWTKVGVTVTPNTATAPNGTLTASKISETTATSKHEAYAFVAHVSGVQYTFKVFAKYSGRHLQIQPSSIFAGSDCYANFDLQNGALGVVGAGAAGATITNVGDGWYLCEMRATATSSSSTPQTTTMADILLITSPSDARGQAYTGDGTSGIYIWGADLRVANDGANLPPYQRVNTATDYDTVGFPHYLRFDGIDDWLVTNTITPGTDKVQVFAGVRKLSDAAHGTVVELGLDTSNTSSGSFCVLSPSSTITVGAQDFQSRGTVVSVARGVRLAPNTNILTGLGDISGDRATLRVNGTQAAQNTTDQGTGNYLAYPLYIGRRGGTSLPFNGHLYSLIVRFGSNLPTATIEKTEKYINTKTRAF